MKKTQIIKEIVGRKLEPFGFRYYKTEGPLRIFIREVHGRQRFYDPENDAVKQYIYIQESHFDKSLIVRFKTDVDNSLRGEELKILEKLSPQAPIPWFNYTDEESYKETLTILTDIIIKYGLDFLEQMSIEESIIPTKAMAEELYLKHKELDQLFTKEYSLDIVPKCEEDIEDWFRIIKQVIIESTELSYEESKELLIKIAAFIGERICEILDEEWVFEENAKIPSPKRIDFKYGGFCTLGDVVRNWRQYKYNDPYIYWFFNIIKELKRGFLDKQK